MRAKSFLAVPALLAGLVAGEAGARSPTEDGRTRIAMSLVVAAGLVGAAIGASLALMPSGEPAPEASGATAAHRPDRPSPVRPQITVEAIAALFPPETGSAANSGDGHHA